MTKLRTFLIGIGVTFGLPWLFLVVIPFFQLRALEPVAYDFEVDQRAGIYPPNYTDTAGARVYAREGCAYCHTQMIRPAQVAMDGWRLGWGQEQGGKPEFPTRPNRPEDYAGEGYAFLGIQRSGPDLANVGWRYDRQWHYGHLYNPRERHPWSLMPSFRHLFEKQVVQGVVSEEAVAVVEEDGVEYQIVPGEEARALVSYLLSMKRDLPVPAALANGRTD